MRRYFSESVPGKIELLSAYTDAEEAFMVVGSITDKMYHYKRRVRSFAILYRATPNPVFLKERFVAGIYIRFTEGFLL